MPTATANNGKLSVQPRFDKKQMADASAYLWTFFDRFTSENTIPEWGNPSRVDKLREFARQEPILVGALSSMTSKAVSLDWQITGGRNKVTRYQEILAEADAGAGWSFFLDRLLQDYWQADQGGFVELGRHGKNGPVLSLYNLDAGTIQLLMSSKTPAAYYPRLITGAVSGKRIPLEPSDFTRIVDMPTPDESKAGLGFCASSRALKVAQVLMALYNYEEERLSDMPVPGIAAITGMTQKEVYDAFQLYKAHREDRQQTTFKGVLWLAAQSSPINPIGVNFTSFASLPEGFDKKTTIELYVYTLALDFGVDVREFWPASQTGATKAEAEIQAQKAKGKGFGRMLSSVERMVNWDVLPEGTEFYFDQKDSEDDLLRETIREKVIANIATLAGGQLISPDEARRWLVELEMAPEWLAKTSLVTVHGNANVDDEEPETVEREEPESPPAEQKTPPAVDQAVAEKARRARLDPGEDFVAVNGAGQVVTLWSSRRVFALGEKRFDPSQPRYPAGDPRGGQWRPEGGAAQAGAEQEAPEPEPAPTKPANEIRIGLVTHGGLRLMTPEEFVRSLDKDSMLARMGITAEDFDNMLGVEGIDADVMISERGDSVIFQITFKKGYYEVGEQTISFRVSDDWEAPEQDDEEEDYYDSNETYPRYPQYDPYAEEEPDAWPGNENIDVHADLLRLHPRFQGHGFADELVNRQFAFAVDKRFNKVITTADITIGKYTWATPKFGFDYKDEDAAWEATRKFQDWCLERGIDLEDEGYGWPEFESVRDVAAFDAGITLSHREISNAEVKPGEYALGKAFMLDDDGHGDWEAVRELRPLWGMFETPRQEMTYYERMLAIGQLPIEFSSGPAYRGTTRWARWPEAGSWIDNMRHQAALDATEPSASGSRWAADARRFHESQGRRR